MKHLNRTTASGSASNSEGLTAEDVYDVVNKTYALGIEGYNPPIKHFDFKQALWQKKRADILTKHLRKWPPNDWKPDKETGVKIKPNRINYIDEHIRWAKSFCNIARANEIKEELANKGHPIDEIRKPKPYPNLRASFLKNEKEKDEKKKSLPLIPEWKTESIEKVKDQIAQDEMKKKEKKFHKSNLSKCDKVSNVDDSIFVGENIPFYNTYDANNKLIERPTKQDKLFYPNKICIWKRSPSWKMFRGREGISEQMKIRDDLLEEKAKSIIENSKNSKEFLLDVSGSFEKINNKRLKFTIAKAFEYDKIDQYVNSKEGRMIKYPGPQSYWKTPVGYLDITKKRSKSVEEGTDPPKRYMPREKTDKRQYKPMRKSVF